MRHIFSAVALGIAAIASVAAVPASAGAPAAHTQAAYTIGDTSLGTLLDDSASLAIIKKYAPSIPNHPQVQMARSLTLLQLQRFGGDTLSDEILAKISAALKESAPR
jgi:hypothetical protein